MDSNRIIEEEYVELETYNNIYKEKKIKNEKGDIERIPIISKRNFIIKIQLPKEWLVPKQYVTNRGTIARNRTMVLDTKNSIIYTVKGSYEEIADRLMYRDKPYLQIKGFKRYGSK